MKWEIKCQIWEMEELNETLSIVFNQIAEEFTRMIPEGPPLGYKPIILVNDPLFEHRVHWPFNQANYTIGLNIVEKNYGEAASQFTHELTHVYCDPRITNWAIKTVAHVASFYMLDRLTEKWKANLPERFEEDTRDDFRDYKVSLMKEAYHRIDLRQHQLSSDWIKNEVKKIHERPELGNRIIFNVIALDILPIFEEDPALWSIIPYLCKSSGPFQPEDIEEMHDIIEVFFDIDKLNEIYPNHLEPSFNKLVSQIWE